MCTDMTEYCIISIFCIVRPDRDTKKILLFFMLGKASVPVQLTRTGLQQVGRGRRWMKVVPEPDTNGKSLYEFSYYNCN